MEKFATDANKEGLRYLNKSADNGLISAEEFFEAISNLTAATKAETIEILVTSYHPEQAVFSYIRSLKPKYKIGLISNIGSPLKDYLPTADLDVFDEQTLSYQVGVAKPDKRIFELHLAKTGTLPTEAVFIDDREVNALAAEGAGLHGICYKNLAQLKAELSRLGVKA